MFRFCDSEFFVCDPGSPVKVTYASKVLDDGTIQLTPSGKINTDEMIESFRESCDINVIMQRINSGDLSAMDKFSAGPMYGDFTQFPKTYPEMLQLKLDVDAQFDVLPVDVKQKFGNDSNQFLASLGSKDWFDKLGISEKVDTIVKETNTDES